jgi:dienelactone hydrolase
MKKLILILISILFVTNVYAHSTKGHTPNLDYSAQCTKKKSVLNFISKHKLFKGKGEIVKFNSYTGFDQRSVLTDGIKKNPIEITGYLSLPEGNGKVPIVIWTHSSGGPAIYIWNDFTHHGYNNLLNAGIGVMFVDNFCHRGAKETWRDQSRVPLINGAIDAMMALKLLKSHPRSNGKFGTTGHSRGGTNGLFLADVKFTSKFIDGTKGFDAILSEAPECRLSGLFKEPELTSNTKLLLVHGELDDYTLAKHCVEYVKKIKAKPDQVKFDVKKGWYHEWHSGSKPKRIGGAQIFHGCPAITVDNEGNTLGEMADLVINKYKLWPSMEAANQSMQDEPRKAFKKMFKVFKGEKCIKKGVTIGGENMDEYMPQFINFFKENLL